MEKTCVTCRSSKVDTLCGVCQGDVCRKCKIFLDAQEFRLSPAPLPEALRHTYYCGACFDEHVAAFKTRFEETLERAKEVNILFKGSRSAVRVQRKADHPVQITDSEDRDETILRLAIHAAHAGFNSVIDVDVDCQKVRNFGWQKSAWSGRGTPAELKSYQLERAEEDYHKY